MSGATGWLTPLKPYSAPARRHGRLAAPVYYVGHA